MTSFSRKNAKIWKTKKIRFFGMASSILLQNFKWIALKLKKMNKSRRRFWCHIYLPWSRVGITVGIKITGFLIILRRVDKVLTGVSLSVTVIPEQKKLNRSTHCLTLIFWWLIFLKERHLLYLSFDFKSTSHWSYKVFLPSKVQLIMIYIQRIEINKTMVLIISLSKCIKASLQSSNSSLFFIKIR